MSSKWSGSNTKDKTVTADEISSVWGNSDFGSTSKEDVVKFGLLKCAAGYYQGHTSRCILEELKLITKKYTLTRRGRFCLYEYFKGDSTL